MSETPARRNGDVPFIISRTFPVPRAQLWAAWTDPVELKQWFGPKGFSLPTCTMDLRPGGTFHYCMRGPGGVEMWGKWTFREVVAQQRLVLVSTFSDAAGGITRHPMSATWPRETLSTTTFGEQDGQATLEIRWQVWDGTPEEHATFDAAHDGMRQGWSGTFEQLAAYLAKTAGQQNHQGKGA